MDLEQDDLALVIKCDQGKLVIKPLRYEYPNSSDAYDRSWISTAVAVKVNGFIGSYTTLIQDVEFAILCKELKYCYGDLNKDFEFMNMERDLGLKIKGDGLGHFFVNVDCEQQHVRLSVEMMFDQSFLPKMIEDLEEINKRYPYNRKMFSI